MAQRRTFTLTVNPPNLIPIVVGAALVLGVPHRYSHDSFIPPFFTFRGWLCGSAIVRE